MSYCCWLALLTQNTSCKGLRFMDNLSPSWKPRSNNLQVFASSRKLLFCPPTPPRFAGCLISVEPSRRQEAGWTILALLLA